MNRRISRLTLTFALVVSSLTACGDEGEDDLSDADASTARSPATTGRPDAGSSPSLTGGANDPLGGLSGLVGLFGDAGLDGILNAVGGLLGGEAATNCTGLLAFLCVDGGFPLPMLDGGPAGSSRDSGQASLDAGVDAGSATDAEVDAGTGTDAAGDDDAASTDAAVDADSATDIDAASDAAADVDAAVDAGAGPTPDGDAASDAQADADAQAVLATATPAP